MGVSESFGDFSEQLLEFVSELSDSSGIFSEQFSECNIKYERQAIQRGPEGQAKTNNKKTWGGEKPKVRVKKACEGARKRPPPHTERPWTPCVRGSLAPLATKDADKIPEKGASKAPAQDWAPSPGSHSSEGWVKVPAG